MRTSTQIATTLLSATAILAVASASIIAPAEPVHAQKEADLFVGGVEKAADKFVYYLVNDYWKDTKRGFHVWNEQQRIPRLQIGQRPIMFTKTEAPKKGADPNAAPARTYFYVVKLGPKGEVIARSGDFQNAVGLVLGAEMTIDLRRGGFDELTLEDIAVFGDPNVFPNDATGSDRLLSYAGFLWSAGAKWAANRALYQYSLRDPSARAKIDTFLRKGQFATAKPEELLETVSNGVSTTAWKELAPKSLHAERRAVRESLTNAELRITRKRMAESIQNGDKLTFDTVFAAKAPQGLGLSIMQLVREIEDTDRFAEDSEALKKDAESANTFAKDPKKTKELQDTYRYWRDEVMRRKKDADEAAKGAEDAYNKATIARQKAEALMKDGKNAADELKEATAQFDKAKEFFAKLIPAAGAKTKVTPLDPNNGRHYFQMGMIQRFACKPDRFLRGCDHSTLAKEAVQQFTISLRYAWENGSARVNMGVCEMLQKNFGPARKLFEGVIKDPNCDSSAKEAAKNMLATLDNNERYR